MHKCEPERVFVQSTNPNELEWNAKSTEQHIKRVYQKKIENKKKDRILDIILKTMENISVYLLDI